MRRIDDDSDNTSSDSAYSGPYDSSAFDNSKNGGTYIDPNDTASNPKAVYNMLIDLGVGPQSAAGAVGGLMGESGSTLRTNAKNAGDGSDGSDSVGWAQWNGSRAKALYSTAQSMGVSPSDPNAQLAHLRNELTGPYSHVLAALKSNDSISNGVNTWVNKYEIPADKAGAIAQRTPLAQKFAGTMAGVAPNSGTAVYGLDPNDDGGYAPSSIQEALNQTKALPYAPPTAAGDPIMAAMNTPPDAQSAISSATGSDPTSQTLPPGAVRFVQAPGGIQVPVDANGNVVQPTTPAQTPAATPDNSPVSQNGDAEDDGGYAPYGVPTPKPVHVARAGASDTDTAGANTPAPRTASDLWTAFGQNGLSGLFGMNNSKSNTTVGDRLTRLGAALMAAGGNSAGASALLNGIPKRTDTSDDDGWKTRSIDMKRGLGIQTNKNGDMRTVQIPGIKPEAEKPQVDQIVQTNKDGSAIWQRPDGTQYQGPVPNKDGSIPAPPEKVDASDFAEQSPSVQRAYMNDAKTEPRVYSLGKIGSELQQYLLDHPEMDVSAVKQAIGKGQNIFNAGTPESNFFKKYENFKHTVADSLAQTMKGSMSNMRMQNVLDEIDPLGAKFSQNTLASAISRASQIAADTHSGLMNSSLGQIHNKEDATRAAQRDGYIKGDAKATRGQYYQMRADNILDMNDKVQKQAEEIAQRQYNKGNATQPAASPRNSREGLSILYGNKPEQTPTPAPTQSGPVKVTSPEDVAKLPSGTIFVAPDGIPRTKK